MFTSPQIVRSYSYYNFSSVGNLFLLYFALVTSELECPSFVCNTITFTDASKFERVQRKFLALSYKRLSSYPLYREIISLGDENTANARWEPAGTVPVTRQRR
jgi:hypothetical protein